MEFQLRVTVWLCGGELRRGEAEFKKQAQVCLFLTTVTGAFQLQHWDDLVVSTLHVSDSAQLKDVDPRFIRQKCYNDICERQQTNV